jgi:hypothetical protein
MAHAADEAWREFPYPAQPFLVIEATGEAVVVESVCPQCHGKSRWSFAVGRPGGPPPAPSESLAEAGVRPADAEDWLEGEPYVICACGYDHERPEDSDEHGCGALWPLRREDS